MYINPEPNITNAPIFSISTDLEYIFTQTESLWEELRDQQIFITGGTGFFGCWFLESFVLANRKLNLNASAVVLTRDKNKFSVKHPHLFQDSALFFIEGDIRTFDFPNGSFSHVIHAATDASAHLNETNPILMWDTIVQGTKR